MPGVITVCNPERRKRERERTGWWVLERERGWSVVRWHRDSSRFGGSEEEGGNRRGGSG